MRNFFRKLWRDLCNGEIHSAPVAWEVFSIGLLLLIALFVGAERLVAYLLH